MDEQLAPIFDYIRGSDALRRNTLILLCSDNGPEPGAGSAGPFRGAKATLYEGGIRSPLIVWGPGLVSTNAAGMTNDKSVFSAIDLAASLLALAAAEPPAGVRLDGEPLPKVLLGESQASRSAPLFFSRPPDRKQLADMEDLPDLAVRDGDWKLLCNYDGGDAQLYDVSKDPGESQSLAAENAAVVNELTALLLEWWAEVSP